MRTTELIQKLVQSVASVGDSEIFVQNKDDGAELPIVEVRDETGDIWIIVRDL